MNSIKIDRKFLRFGKRELSYNDIIFLYIMSIFLLSLALWGFFSFGPLGIVIAFIIGSPALPIYLAARMREKQLKKVVLELFETYCTIYDEEKEFRCDYQQLDSVILKEKDLCFHLQNGITLTIEDADGLNCDLNKLIYVLNKKKETDTPLEELFLHAPYHPNHYSITDRLVAIYFGLQIIALCGYGIYKGKLYLPSRHPELMALTGISFYIGLLSGFFGLIAIVLLFLDHYDTRDNEKLYKKWIDRSLYAAYSLIFLAMIVSLYSK